MITEASFTQMSDSDLVSAAARLAAAGREATADLIALLVVLEERKQVFADEGYSSVFRFCVGRLRLSEEEAYYRIAAARVATRFPEVPPRRSWLHHERHHPSPLRSRSHRRRDRGHATSPRR